MSKQRITIIQTGNHVRATQKPNVPKPTINAGTVGSRCHAEAINKVGRRNMARKIRDANIPALKLSMVNI